MDARSPGSEAELAMLCHRAGVDHVGVTNVVIIREETKVGTGERAACEDHEVVDE